MYIYNNAIIATHCIDCRHFYFNLFIYFFFCILYISFVIDTLDTPDLIETRTGLHNSFFCIHFI